MAYLPCFIVPVWFFDICLCYCAVQNFWGSMKIRQPNLSFRLLGVLLITTLSACSSSVITGKKPLYEVKIDYAKEIPASLKEKLEEARKLMEEKPSAVQDESYVRYSFGQDELLLQKLLKAEGYYQAEVESSFDEKKHIAHFAIKPNEIYHFDKIGMKVIDKLPHRATPVKTPDQDVIKLKVGDVVNASAVLEEENRLGNWLEEHNCLFDYEVTHSAYADHDLHTISIIFELKLGAEAKIGEVSIKGLRTLSAPYMQKKIPIKTGGCFRKKDLTQTRIALQNTGLLSQSDIKLPNAPDAQGNVPVTLNVIERPNKTVKAGANYSTDIGPGVTAGWEHRNLFGQAEKLSTSLSVASVESSIGGQFEKPEFLRDDQRLKLGLTLTREDSDAYENTGINFTTGIERSLKDKWQAGVGTRLGFNRIKDEDSTDNFALLGIPLFISKDARDNVLNPLKGWTFRFDSTPFVDVIDHNTNFFKNKMSGSYFFNTHRLNDTVIALRAAAGSITGADTQTVPATERFYVGGGGSVRGYGYKLVGPLNSSKNPVGGRSFIETSTELRFRFAESYGAVAFLDGGNAYDATFPDFEGGMLWGAGVGFRYYTDFGPLRADIALPLDRRAGVDDAYQFYISIGQAF